MSWTNSPQHGPDPFSPTTTSFGNPAHGAEAESAAALPWPGDAGDPGSHGWESAWIDLGGEG